jgi:hypothetical protein
MTTGASILEVISICVMVATFVVIANRFVTSRINITICDQKIKRLKEEYDIKIAQIKLDYEKKIEELQNQVTFLLHQLVEQNVGQKTKKVRNKISNSKINVKPGENTKFKMSKSALGKKKSEEHKQNMSKAKLNNQYRKGKTHSEFSKSLIGNKNRHPKPDGFSEKISKAKQGKVIEAKYKPITQYDLDNNFIKEWSSIKEAELFFRPNKKIQDNIGKVCRLMSKTAYNFKWKFKEENN